MPQTRETPNKPDARPPILEVRALTKTFTSRVGFRRREVRALNDVSFSVQRGEIVALVGESGSGKSTIARIVARLLQPTSGQIFLDGEDVLATEPRRASLSYRKRVQMVFQDPFGSLNPVHSVAHHLIRPLVRHGIASNPAELELRVHELLSGVGLNPAADFAGKKPHEMSGGQRQRVAIARALAVAPELILADEPTSMLDVSIRMGVLNLLDRLRTERDLSFLYITHDLASARYVADRTLVLYGGSLMEEGPSDAVMQQPAHPYTQLLLSAVPDPRRPAASNVELPSGPRMAGTTGCPFAGRCPAVMDRCGESLPPKAAVAKGHFVRCHLVSGPPAVAGKGSTSLPIAPAPVEERRA
jgi:peptide/nickel transport system ATP-binding protein